VLAGAGIFQHVVHQRRTDRIGVHAPLDHGTGHGQRMGDVRLPRHALLVRMGLGREVVRGLDSRYIDRGEIVETIEENPVGGFLTGRRQR